MLNPEVKKRFTAIECLKHEWFKNKSQESVKLNPEIFKQLTQYRAENTLKKEAMHVIVRLMKSD